MATLSPVSLTPSTKPRRAASKAVLGAFGATAPHSSCAGADIGSNSVGAGRWKPGHRDHQGVGAGIAAGVIRGSPSATGGAGCPEGKSRSVIDASEGEEGSRSAPCPVSLAANGHPNCGTPLCDDADACVKSGALQALA